MLEANSGKLIIENKIQNEPKKIMITFGGNQAFVNALILITNFGYVVLILSPYYLNHIKAIQLAGDKSIIMLNDGNYKPNLLDNNYHDTLFQWPDLNMNEL